MNILFQTGNDLQHAHPSWYRGEDCNLNPTKNALHSEPGLDEYILKGWLPPAPFISRDMQITAFGSCFAKHLSEWLMRQQYATGERRAAIAHGVDFNIYDSHVIRFGEGIVNTFALRQQFEWALEGRQFSEALWFGSHGELARYSEAARASTQALFLDSNVFIITLGLSEVWCNKRTGDVFWRAIPRDRFDPAIHGFRVSTVEENRRNLESIHRIIRAHRPSATIVVTLSPIPLVATFRPVSCITANSVSKSILRVAVDEFVRAHADDRSLFYWPSYEIVKEYFNDPYLDDNRHPRGEVIDSIMRTFATHFLIDPYSDEEMRTKVCDARVHFDQIAECSPDLKDACINMGILDCRSLATMPIPFLTTLIGSLDVAKKIRAAAAECHLRHTAAAHESPFRETPA